MFSRAVPRVASRAAGLAQCEASQVAAGAPSWALRSPQHLSRRYRSTFREQFREQFRRSPISFPFALVSIFALAGWGAYYIPWYYHNVIQKPYHNFPEPVAKKLRRAIFYSRGQHLDIREANKYFRQALQLATEMGMDPFSDEIMGVKYAIAALFEEQGYHAMACDVLEIMRTDTQRWIDEFSDKHITDGNRSRVKKNMVQINLKLGQLYDCPYVNEPQDAEKRLVEAVEGALGELQRRETEGIKQGEGDWMTNDELGATLEALGQHYEHNDSHYLALPLFLRALELCPPTSCHSVVLMNNISTCLAQQTPPPASLTSSSPSSFPNAPAPPRTALVDQARQWADKALQRAGSITDQDEECNVGCAVATHNLGEFYEMEGKIQDARRKYKDAEQLAKKIGFREGQANAKAGIARLKELEKAQQ
ncbi:hypothetical protein DPSP01_009855 [Paraphaeosphaeria sporulosa]|uniref:TPR domain-containing protein n=1 Tax=Paraphaeosphaeria sporulosa TaxID=1460663 RepID=A0A177BTC4_9PLEO|nr:uncharacterized protein CC84DRAFT_1210728 [Paraphaeosphaeria sporulosa]OAF98643.1 hypothetical protein CC84DRAFT_1210728 [Paraphaeosphaeria sporulosa]